MVNFVPGQSVGINAYVYDDQWDGHEELWKKFRHRVLTVDRVIDLTDVGDVGDGVWVIVECMGRKAKVKPSYLWDATYPSKAYD